MQDHNNKNRSYKRAISQTQAWQLNQLQLVSEIESTKGQVLGNGGEEELPF